MDTDRIIPSECLASLAADLFYKVQKGLITLDELARFVQRQNPFSPSTWELNEHGHIVLNIRGLDLTGAQELVRLRENGYHFDECNTLCFRGKGKDSYDRCHRLIAGYVYRVVLMPGKEISASHQRTTKNLLALANRYGYMRPQAGIILRLREYLIGNDYKRKEMTNNPIVVLHKPIEEPMRIRHSSLVFGLGRGTYGRLLDTYVDRDGDAWGDNLTFAFLVPGSAQVSL
jgi:hypothetical protein